MSAVCHVLLDCGGSRPPSVRAPGELRLFTKCRNELLRLPAFLRHYRQLGVERFFFADNASTDGTFEYLTSQPDVHVFRTQGRFSEARGGTDWLNALLAQFGVGGWCVTVDVDELLVFPGAERVQLPALTRHLDATGAEALGCLLLDLYPEGRLRDAVYQSGAELIAAAPFFDASPYRTQPYHECPGFLTYGGVRERFFYPEARANDLKRRAHVTAYHRLLLKAPLVRELPQVRARRPVFPPCLTKVPLVRWERDTRYLNVNHFVSPRKVAPESGVLLHFKLLGDFHARAQDEVARGEYYDGAIEFRRYSARLRDNPEAVFMCELSTRFEDSEQLVRLGLMRDSSAWQSARSA